MSQEPQKPDDSECCGSGCKPCVFDVYEDKLKKWKAGLLKSESKALNQIKYLPFVIIDIKTITNYLKIFKFQSVVLETDNHNGVVIKEGCGVKSEILNDYLPIRAGEYLIVKGVFRKDGKDVVISRSYTPVLSEEFDKGVFTVIIALIQNGQMSEFFRSLNVNDVVFWRGPYQEFNYVPNKYKNLILFGGGTGVVPLYNISKTIVENDLDDTRVHLISSYKTVETILLRKQFKLLKDFWNFQMTIFISDENDDGHNRHNETIFFRRMNGDDVRNEIQKVGEDFFVIICGPGSFNDFVRNEIIEMGIKEENIFIFW